MDAYDCWTGTTWTSKYSLSSLFIPLSFSFCWNANWSAGVNETSIFQLESKYLAVYVSQTVQLHFILGHNHYHLSFDNIDFSQLYAKLFWMLYIFNSCKIFQMNTIATEKEQNIKCTNKPYNGERASRTIHARLIHKINNQKRSIASTRSPFVPFPFFICTV